MKTKRTVHVTVTVPKVLKTKMEKLGGKVNWSRVARNAFRKEIKKSMRIDQAA